MEHMGAQTPLPVGVSDFRETVTKRRFGKTGNLAGRMKGICSGAHAFYFQVTEWGQLLMSYKSSFWKSIHKSS